MSQSNKKIFISYASDDVERKYVEAVAKAIEHCGYSPYFMKSELRDATKGQNYLSKQIRQSILMLVLIDYHYKDGVRYELEKVAKKGKKIGTYVFFQKYPDSTPQHELQDDIIKKNLKDVNYCRDHDFNDLPAVIEKNLPNWIREEKERREKEGRKKMGYTAVAVLAGLLFCLLVPYIKIWLEGVLGPKTNGVKIETSTGVKDEIPIGGKNETPTGVKDEIPTGGKNETPVDVKGETHTGDKGETPTDKNGTVGTTGKKTIPEQELSVMVPNTFAVVCDDELFSAGISDAVSKVLPSLSQSADISKAQWTISVKQHVVQEIPKIIDSDALQVDVHYTVDIKNNAENEGTITKQRTKRGRSIIQNRDDAIRNANEEVTKDIANILKSIQQ